MPHDGGCGAHSVLTLLADRTGNVVRVCLLLHDDSVMKFRGGFDLVAQTKPIR